MNKFYGAKVREARIAKHISMFKLAVICDVTPQSVQNWEQGTHEPKATALMQLSLTLEKPVEYFFVEGRTDA